MHLSEGNEDDVLKKAISFKDDQKIDELKRKIIERYREIEAQAGTGPGTDDPQGPGPDPEEDPIIKGLRKRIKELEEKLESHEKRIKYLEGDQRVVIIGELCRRLQENIYRCVLPTDKIVIYSWKSYKVKKLHKFIDERKKLTPKDKKDAKERWAQIKTDLNWPDDDEEDWEDLIEGLQGLRNVKSHPTITGELKQKVMDAIEDSNNKKIFESMKSSPEDVKKLLQMFEETEKMLK